MPVKHRKRPIEDAASLESAPLPYVPAYVEDVVEDYLTTENETKRPPRISARILALLVALHKEKRPLPSRIAMAHATGATVWGVDAAISTALRREMIFPRTEVRPVTFPSGRDSIERVHYYVPSETLFKLVERAERRNKSVRAHAA